MIMTILGVHIMLRYPPMSWRNAWWLILLLIGTFTAQKLNDKENGIKRRL